MPRQTTITKASLLKNLVTLSEKMVGIPDKAALKVSLDDESQSLSIEASWKIEDAVTCTKDVSVRLV